PGTPDLAGLEPMAPLARRWPSYLGAAVTLVMIVWLGLKLHALGVDSLVSALPSSPLFYLFFGLFYLSPVTGDFIIFRKLWGIPAAGYVALTKKRIANDVLNYSGEAYFYAWARQRSSMVAAPFGAVKDVSILSAIAGNMVTLAMIAIAMPQIMRLCVSLSTMVCAPSCKHYRYLEIVRNSSSADPTPSLAS
ncbi:hypothetical protein, partial [Pseudomonas sp. EA_65y_Pfl1_P113]|uniref:hypothetical protein n=1 Tax=Pseudomonas sp. EA_65y_Pfl1_P113 TaxID=3088692 RepID=UPI0030DCBCA1